jgi:hypothetical protein
MPHSCPLGQRLYGDDRTGEEGKDGGGFLNVGQEPGVYDDGPEADGKLGAGEESKNKYLICEYQA